MADSEDVRLTATVTPEVAAEVRQMAKAMNTSVTRLLGVLLTVAIKSTSGTFQAFASDMDRLMGKDEPNT